MLLQYPLRGNGFGLAHFFAVLVKHVKDLSVHVKVDPLSVFLFSRHGLPSFPENFLKIFSDDAFIEITPFPVINSTRFIIHKHTHN